MSEGVKTTEEKAAEARRGPARRGGPPHMAMGQPTEKSLDFGPSAKRLLGRLRPHRFKVAVVLVFAVVSVALSSIGPKILGRATDLIFAGVIGGQMPAGATKEQVIEGLRAKGQDGYADLLSNVDFVPGQGIDFDAVASVLLLVTALFVAASLLMWIQGWILQGVLAADDVRPAPGGRGQAQQAAAALLRQPAARRDPQPCHQRHRQRRAVAAADALAAAQLAAHRHRGARHHVLDLVEPRAHRPRQHPDLDRRHRRHRQALAEALRAAVAQHRRAQRHRRGDLHRPRPRQGLRPPEGDGRQLQGEERRALRGGLRGAVHQRHHHAGHDVRREPQLRRHRRRRWPPGRERHDEPR